MKKGFEGIVQRVTKNEDYKFGDGTKVLVESAKEGLEKLGRTLGVVPDYESKVFSVPLGCRRFLLRPDTAEDDHWSLEFHDAAGNIALMLCAHRRLNLLVCNFVHQGRPGEECRTQYHLLGLQNNRPVYITLHPNAFIIASYNGHSLAFAPGFLYNSGALVCNNPERAREIFDARSWVQLTDKHTGQAFWYNRLTSLSTHLKPFELGGRPLFHESRGRPPVRSEPGAAMIDQAASAGAGAAPVLAQRELRASDADLAAAQEQSRDFAEAASAPSQEPPEDFFDNVFDCLIMEDPVFAMDGFTYERKRIEEWLANNSRSPTTGQELGSKMVVPNHLLRSRIVQWKETHGF